MVLIIYKGTVLQTVLSNAHTESVPGYTFFWMHKAKKWQHNREVFGRGRVNCIPRVFLCPAQGRLRDKVSRGGGVAEEDAALRWRNYILSEHSIVLKSNCNLLIPFSNPFLSSSKLWNVSEATWGFPQRLVSSTFSSNLIHRAVSFHSISSPCFVSSSSSTNAWNEYCNQDQQ